MKALDIYQDDKRKTARKRCALVACELIRSFAPYQDDKRKTARKRCALVARELIRSFAPY